MNTTTPPPFLPADRDRLRSQSFTRAAYAIALHDAGGIDDVETFARATWEFDTKIARITRAAVTPTDTSATAIAAASVGDFIASLQPISGAARLMAAALLLRAPSGANTVAVPWASDVTADFVAQGAPIPVAQGSISDIVLTPSQKIALILSASNALLASTNGEAVLEAMLRRAAAQALDTALFGNTAGDTTRPAGLLAGVGATTATMTLGGDLKALADAVVAGGGDGNILFFTSPGRVFSAQAQSLGHTADLRLGGNRKHENNRGVCQRVFCCHWRAANSCEP